MKFGVVILGSVIIIYIFFILYWEIFLKILDGMEFVIFSYGDYNFRLISIYVWIVLILCEFVFVFLIYKIWYLIEIWRKKLKVLLKI